MIPRIRGLLAPLLIVMVAPAVLSQQMFDARATSMAFSNGADAPGLQSAGLNPAMLADKTVYNLELTLFSAVASAYNNSLNRSQYDDYFTTGEALSSAEIDDILASIPTSGFRANARARVSSLSFYMPKVSLSITGILEGNGKLPKELLALPLEGNSVPGRVYPLDGAGSSAWAGLGINLSGALPFNTEGWQSVDLLAAGITVKYLAGFYNHEVVKSTGELRDFNLAENNRYISVDASGELLTAEGGKGLAADIGGVIRVNKRWTAGLTLVNLLGAVRWSDKAEQRIFELYADSLSVPFDLPQEIFTDSSIAVDGYSTRLPFVIDLSTAYRPGDRMLLTAAYEQGFNERLGGTRRPRLAMGIEYRALPSLPLRGGVNLGGKLGASLAMGLGIELTRWTLDLAMLNHGGVFTGDLKGLSLAMTSRLRF